MLRIPKFKNKSEEIAFIVANKSILMSQKKSEIKRAEGSCMMPAVTKIRTIEKTAESGANKELQVKAVINTTNVLDSHGDVHIPGLWNKSLKENKRMMHVQEHKTNQFDKIISSGKDLKSFVQTMTWKELGYKMKGNTQALMFDSNVKKSRNPYMYDQYKKEYVDNHSVGMIYVKMKLAVDDKKHPEEFATWEKYYPQVVNQKEADRRGHMWIILEAKAVEGSAVPNGSNSLTPTMSVSSKESKKSKKELKKIAKKKELKSLIKAIKNY